MNIAIAEDVAAEVAGQVTEAAAKTAETGSRMTLDVGNNLLYAALGYLVVFIGLALLMAVIICAVVLFGWEPFCRSMGWMPARPAPGAAQTAPQTAVKTPAPAVAPAPVQKGQPPAPVKPVKPAAPAAPKKAPAAKSKNTAKR